MADDPSTLAAKCSLDYLKTILKITSEKSSDTGQRCGLCGHNDCLEFGPDRFRPGQWFFKCYSCSETGDVVKAIKVSTGMGFAEVFKKIREDFKGRVHQSEHDAYHKQRAAERNGTPQLALPAPVERFEKPDPVLDMERAEKVVQDAHEYLMHDFTSLNKKWQRGLSEEVAIKYRLGFIEHESVTFYPWSKPMSIPAAWVLPITDADGVLKGVKLHFEERPYFSKGQCPKCMWYPLGTVPAYEKKMVDGHEVIVKPVHSYYSMWPHPETLRQVIVSDFSLEPEYWIQRIPDSLRAEWENTVESHKVMLGYELGKADNELEGAELWTAQLRAFDEMKQKIFKLVIKKVNIVKKNCKESSWESTIFVCPGELKALAVESAGLMATAVTGGESWMPGSNLLKHFAGKHVCLFGDNDPGKRVMDSDGETVKKITCAGQDWVNKWTAALRMHGALRVSSKVGGVKEKK